MTTDTKLADLPANVGAAAQARRLYQHVCNGGAVTPQDICRIVATIEKLEAALARQSPSYEALSIIALSDAAALERAGVTECDDPGESIDVIRARAAIDAAMAAQPQGEEVGRG
jgi:hypothetical protein